MRWLFVRRLRSFVLLAAAASLVLNIALLMPAIYMMQVFDRVFASNSVETLVMLGLITLLFLALGFFVDTVRARALAWAGRSLDRKLAPAAIRSSLQQAAAGAGHGRHRRAARHRAAARRFSAGRACWRCSMRPGPRSICCSSRSCIRCSGSRRRSAHSCSSRSACSPIGSRERQPEQIAALLAHVDAHSPRSWRATPK